MAYGVYGFVKYKDSTGTCKIARGYVLPYFKKVQSSSSPSKWATTPYNIESTGYYTFDLDDNALLGVTGKYAKTKDKIYIAFYWEEGNLLNKNKDTTTITHAAFIDHALVEADTFELNVELYAKYLPKVNTSVLPADNLLTRTNYTMSEDSVTDTSWSTPTCAANPKAQQSQKLTYDTVGIFDGHQMLPTIYDWDEIAPRNKTPSAVDRTNTSDTYAFQVAGVYNISMTVREKWNTQVIISKTVTVRYNDPIPDFDWLPFYTNTWDGAKLKGQEEITFTNKSTDIDGRTDSVYTYNWVIEDKNYNGSDNTKTYTNQPKTFKPKHKFQSPGEKTITLTINWNDGFVNKQVSISKTLEIFPFTIVPKIVNVPEIPKHRGEEVNIEASGVTTGDTSQIFQYDWIIEDHWNPTLGRRRAFNTSETSKWMEGSPNPSSYVDNTYVLNNVEFPKVHFHSEDDSLVTVTIHYYNGWVNVTDSTTKVIKKAIYNIAPQFSWTPLKPIDRDVSVIFANDTVDEFDLGRNTSWYIQDSFELYNPNNPNYGTNSTNNQTNHVMMPYTFTPVHKFQSILDSEVKLTIHFDDGWMEDQRDVIEVVTKQEHVLNPWFETLNFGNLSITGPVVAEFMNTTTGTTEAVARIFPNGEEWTIVDNSGIDSNTYTHHVTNHPKFTIMPYAFKWPSGTPTSSTLGFTTNGMMKIGTLKLHYDNGWNDQSFDSVTREFRVGAYTVHIQIDRVCNIDKYQH